MSTVAIGTIAAGALGAGASIYGAGQQADAANNAAALNYQAQQNALDFQKQQWQTNQTNAAPWIQAGQGAVGNLYSYLQQAGQGQGPLANWTGNFSAPTAAEAEATPGYQFELGQGLKGIQNSAAASGDLLSGGTLKNMDLYANNVASTNYQQAYNNALQQYQQSYNQYQQGQSNTFNRLASVAGLGQTAAGQLGSQGVAAGNSIANTYLQGSQYQGNALYNAATAQASGYTGAANAFSGGLSNLSQLAMYGSMYGSNQNIDPYRMATSG